MFFNSRKATPTRRTHIKTRKYLLTLKNHERFHSNKKLMVRRLLWKESSFPVVVIRPLPAPLVNLFVSRVRLLHFSMFDHAVLEVQQGTQRKPYALIMFLVLLRNFLFCMACVFLSSQCFEEILSVSTWTCLSFFVHTAQLSIISWTLGAGLHSQPRAWTWRQRLEKPVQGRTRSTNYVEPGNNIRLWFSYVEHEWSTERLHSAL